MTARKGLLVYRNLHASEYKGGQPIFKGRIAVDRGSGVLEFPNPSQFGRIAREEGVAAEHVRQAFGHMKGLKKNARRRGGKVIRQGFISLADPESGERDEWVFEELPPSVDPTQAGWPADHRIMHTRGGTIREGGVGGLIDVGRALQIARAQGVSATEFKRAFGHMDSKLSVPGAKSGPRAIDYYGPRRMKLGHFDEGSGQVKGGVRKGSLVLYDKNTGAIPWAAQVIPKADRHKMGDGTEKAILIRYLGKSYDVTFDQALTGRGLRGAARKELSAAARNIPALSFLNAFSFLLPKAQARRLYHEAGARKA